MNIEVSETPKAGDRLIKFRKYSAVIILVVLSFALGLNYGRSGQRLISNPLKFTESNRQAAPKDVNWQLLWDALAQIDKKYVGRPVDKQQELYGAVAGAVAGLGDPYSVFFPPKDAQEFQNELSGQFEGIGAEVAIKNQELVVVTPLDDSPALKAGLKAGDFIYKIDGTATAGLSVEEAVAKIRGTAGTKVILTIVRKGQDKPIEVPIVRAQIEVKSVSYEIKEVNGKKIGYLKISRFGDDTEGLFNQAVSDFLVKNVNGIAVDLRNNPGGYLDTAVALAGNWVEEGKTVVIQRYGDGTEDTHKSKGPARLSGIPTVVLINGGSASASEILSGALHDHNLAQLVGEKSFGKGSVQELIDLRDNAELKITVAKWLTPNGHDLNKDGLEPDVKVELTDADFQADKDPQLDKAFEVLTK